jgi:DNA (cytosine-5)-methyltransferase 1
MVWENVPGAFSSNKGEDFRAVLEETARVADKNAVIPGPPGGRWTPSGCIMGDGWSIAWRVHDAQFWGVPQRRKRIALVADFGGATAPEILFERESVSRDSAESGETRENTPGDSAGDSCAAISFQERAGKPGGARGCLFNESGQEHCQRLTINQSSPEKSGGGGAMKRFIVSKVMVSTELTQQDATEEDGEKTSPIL